MNNVVDMNREGFELIAWNPDTQDWVMNRKYIAVLKENGTHWLTDWKGEKSSYDSFALDTDTNLMFSFVYFVGLDFVDDQGIFLVFEKEGRQTGLLLDHCIFYKNANPPVLKELRNKLKQKLT